jgi:RimJ/RimL family protein N-acetyltransferase
MIADARPPDVLDVGSGVWLRRTHLDDAVGIATAVAESLPGLRRWMPWATEEAARPQTQRTRLEALLPRWDHGSEYQYVILVHDRVIGSMGLEARIGPRALELGYWLHSEYTGRGIATACARALTGAALELPQVDRVEIHCDEANTRSSAVAQRLGYQLARVEDREITASGETGRSRVWVFPPSEVRDG